MKKYLYIISLIVLPILLVSATNDDFVERLKSNLYAFKVEQPREKTYLQTDKTYYKPSEIIWYKGFLVNGDDNRMSRTSDIVYVELIDPWGKVVRKQDQYAESGTYSGMFHITTDSPGGIYKLKAYTRWMKNDTKRNIFEKEITVQKLITPRILLKVDFEKRAYGAGDKVTANLKVTDLDNNKTTGSDVESTVRIGGVAIQTLKNVTENGEVAITFTLPNDLDSSDGILQMIVRDKGVEESITRSIPIVLNKIDVKFYPEGGDLIEGVKNKVAFEGLNEFGKGADISGNILDESGNIVTTFSSYHLGMGAFNFEPKNGKTYYAQILKPEGNANKFALPEAKKEGYVLTLDSKNEKRLSWKIYSSSSERSITLVGQTQQQIYYSEEVSLKKGWNKIEVPTNDFPIGIAVFTLFEREKEVAERLVFINPEKEMKIKFETDKEIYLPSEKVHLTITTTDKDDNPVSANLGLAVVDEQILTMADDKQDNLLSYVLFSSELKGKIQEPSFYFDRDEPKAKEAIDYLMLTHGWRHFVWDEVLNPLPQEPEFVSEKAGSVYGYILNGNGNPAQADVFLIEIAGKKRIGKVRTTKEGHFVFHNINVSGSAYITTRFPNQVFLAEGKPQIAKQSESSELDMDEEGLISMRDIPEALRGDEPNNNVPVLTEVDSSERLYDSYSDEGYMMSGDRSAALEEVVVVGYGSARKSSMTGSISQVRSSDLYARSSTSDQRLLSAMSGKVAGLTVSQQDVSVGNNWKLNIRGSSTFASDNNPLVVINGVPVNSSMDSPFAYLNPNDISEISILKDASATAVYGSRAANGVLLITTRTDSFHERFVPGKANYGGVITLKRVFYKAPEYLQYRENPKNENSTVYWNGNFQTNRYGRGTIAFDNNSNSSTFRITAEGLSPNIGLIGSNSKRIVTQKPFSIDSKVPLFAAVGDLVKVPVMVKNATDKPIVATVQIDIAGDLLATKDIKLSDGLTQSQQVTVPAKETQMVYFPIEIGQTEGNMGIRISARSDDSSENLDRSITIRQINFPYSKSFSGRDMGETYDFVLPEYVPATLRAEAIAYISTLDELLSGVEGIIREPHGCFEQLSSSTFPNIFALQLMKTTGQTKPEFHKKVMGYLERGCKRLAAYEVKGSGGFEWYGGSPAHEVLSAYGLLEFYEMSKVYNNVDQAMMARTLKFILSRKDGDGGFKQNSGKYGFSGAPKNVNNAYIVYALTETNNKNNLDKEYQTALDEAFKSKDMYRMALMANAAHNMLDMDAYNRLIQLFKESISKSTFAKIDIEATIVRSYGEPAKRETTAYWLMALLKDKGNRDEAFVQQCVQYISKGRSHGMFGNSQTTSMCLQALTKYAEQVRGKGVEGSFCLEVNGDLISCRNIQDILKSGDASERIFFTGKLKKGTNTIKPQFKDSKDAYPYTINIIWQSPIPASKEQCPLRLTTHIASDAMKVNETVRLSVQLQNTKKEAQPMSVAIIGIPGGMSLQPWQLKELQDKEVFDFYEIINDNLIIYYRELGPSETKVINLDLKAEIAGQYRGIASSAYVYYMDEFKHWIKGLSVNIEE